MRRRNRSAPKQGRRRGQVTEEKEKWSQVVLATGGQVTSLVGEREMHVSSSTEARGSSAFSWADVFAQLAESPERKEVRRYPRRMRLAFLLFRHRLRMHGRLLAQLAGMRSHRGTSRAPRSRRARGGPRTSRAGPEPDPDEPDGRPRAGRTAS
jgi:hypothetical protein